MIVQRQSRMKKTKKKKHEEAGGANKKNNRGFATNSTQITGTIRKLRKKGLNEIYACYYYKYQ